MPRGVHFLGTRSLLKGGTMVDATILPAPSSTKNEAGQRDPEMHQTQKGNQGYFVRFAEPPAKPASCVAYGS